MLASQLIVLLQKKISEEGDGHVFAYDGMDPSSPSEVTGLEKYEEWDPVAHRYAVKDEQAILLTT